MYFLEGFPIAALAIIHVSVSVSSLVRSFSSVNEMTEILLTAPSVTSVILIPLAVESLGAWHKSAVAEVKKLGSALARHTGEEEQVTIQRLFQKLSVSLIKGNVALFNNRNPSDMGIEEEEITW